MIVNRHSAHMLISPCEKQWVKACLMLHLALICIIPARRAAAISFRVGVEGLWESVLRPREASVRVLWANIKA